MLSKKIATPALALAAALASTMAVSGAANLARADVMTAKKIVCTPDRMARCDDAGKCNWQDADEKARSQPLTVDFDAKEASVDTGGQSRKFGIIVSDEVEGDARVFVIARDEQQADEQRMRLSLTKDGKMTGSRNAEKVKLEATCKAA